MSRRQFLGAAGATVAGLATARWSGRLSPRATAASGRDDAAAALSPDLEMQALRALGRSTRRAPGSRPDPSLAAGVDTLPEIKTVVVLMMENHSYDNLFGMLRRGDGFTLGRDGKPTASNPYRNGDVQHAFRMPTTCQLSGTPSQEWTSAHAAYNGGRMDGFVEAPIAYLSSDTVGGVAMGYWDREALPFTYDLASTFPIGDRWFCSLLGQTDPNRRYLIAGTSAGMVDDVGAGLGSGLPDGSLPLPANGTIFDSLDRHGIEWADYAAQTTLTGETPNLYPTDDLVTEMEHAKPMTQFFADAADGKLPPFVFLDPNYSTQSQENPQNIAVGEAFLASVIEALGRSPQWNHTLLAVMYDEHGGYFDHVPPPAALAPDLIPPLVEPGQSSYDGFQRYGIRVPSVVISPYARRNHVSHVVHDHTSVLALVERKWNLPALTHRDANANDLTDFLDLDAMRRGVPTFAKMPRLAAPGDTKAALACSTRGPGTVPPPGSITGRH
jgi:phospholipase C